MGMYFATYGFNGINSMKLKQINTKGYIVK